MHSELVVRSQVDTQLLDPEELQIFTDVIELVMQGTTFDSQILLWLCKSTALLRRWREVFSRRRADLLGRQLRALQRFMDFDLEEPEFLFSTEVRDALFEALQAKLLKALRGFKHLLNST